ncbi:MAG: hypothetical protein HJJLKODD_00244 [Phycisphaerae bacterium]|nr:hypothetical protein [Phycisphaerae bacterium]
MADYDVIIIGAGMSGLAAGIRLACFDRRVLIIERHSVYGGLNSFYTLDGHRFDVGLHALTNYVPKGTPNKPLTKLTRQLRISYDSLELFPQDHSLIHFPEHQLRFSNDISLMIDEVARAFPAEADRFGRLVREMEIYDETALTTAPRSSRTTLGEYLQNPVLIDMLLCPTMYYGNPREQDMEWHQFAIMFKSLFLEGFARPRGGIRRMIAQLVKKYREYGGLFRMGCGVKRLVHDDQRVSAVVLDDGTELTAEQIISSAGYHETMQLCSLPRPEIAPAVGQLSFTESISVLKHKPRDLGITPVIIFFNTTDRFNYAVPGDLIDPHSGVICCPNNYYPPDQDEEPGLLRITSLANYDRWTALSKPEYRAAKEQAYLQTTAIATRLVPDFRPQVTYHDLFTPRTIKKFTGHWNGAVYGSPDKIWNGRTSLENLYLCGTDQGFLGIIGAALSGITIANLHVLSAD